jgi:hypothetical protein
MSLSTEPDRYEKTIISDLQDAWEYLRETVIEEPHFNGWEKMMFHINDAMSWETVRHLERMGPLVLLIRQLAIQGRAPADVVMAIDGISALLSEAMSTE